MAKKTKKKRKAPAWATIRVDLDTLESLKAISAEHSRPCSWVAAQAIAAYAVVQDLNDSAGIGRKLEVRA
jgi:predicted transcriptional regulator